VGRAGRVSRARGRGGARRAVGSGLDEARVGKARRLCQGEEVVPVEGAAQALAVEERVVAQVRRHSAVGVHVGKVHLSPRLEDAEGLAQHRRLVGREVDHAWEGGEAAPREGQVSRLVSGERLAAQLETTTSKVSSPSPMPFRSSM